MSLLASIPAPTRDLGAPEPVERAPEPAPSRIAKEIPPYGQRKGFVPRKPEDYGDGEQLEPYFACYCQSTRLHSFPSPRSSPALAGNLPLQVAPTPRYT